MTVLLRVLVFGLFSLHILSGVASAAGPQWAAGFPKTAQKNVLLQWSPVTGAAEYKVYRAEDKGKTPKLIATVKTNRHIDSNAPAGKTLYYYVAAVVKGKEGERSAAGNVTTQAEKVFVPLKAPKLVGSLLKEQPGGVVAVSIRWEGGSGTDLAGFNVYRSKARGRDYVNVGSSSADSYTDTDVARGDTYYYVVTAFDNQFKETKYSNELSVPVPAPASPKAAAPGAPAGGDKVLPTEMKKAKLLFRIPAEPASAKDSQAVREFMPDLALDVKVDEAVGHIYVAGYMYGGVLVYNMDGKLQFGIRKDGVNGKQKFNSIQNIAIGENGNIYVSDYSGDEVRVFDFSGKPVETIKVDGSYMPEMKGKRLLLYGVAVAKDGTLFVGDPPANRIHVFDTERKRVRDIVPNKKDKAEFNGPSYMALDKDGNLVFVDAGYARLAVFGKDGKHKKFISKMGTNAGELTFPTGIATGNGGEVLVASGTSPNIQAFGTDGKFLYAICNEKCDGAPDIGEAKGIHVDKNNRLYVAEGFMNRVSVFQLMEGVEEVIAK